MKKYILIIVIIVIIVATLGLVYYFLKPGTENNTSNGGNGNEEKPDYLVYTDEKWGFEINYLTKWKEETLQGQGLVPFKISAPKERSGKYEAAILVTAFNPSPGQVFEDEMQESIKELEAENSLVSSSKETISGDNAYKLVYAYNDPFSGSRIKQQHYFIDGGETWYQILYTAEEERFDEYLLEVEQMTETFRITK